MADEGRLEERVVEVNDPKLSDEVNRRLTAELREIIGRDRVLVPADRPRVSQGERAHIRPQDKVTSTILAIIGFVAIAAIVGLIIALVHASWFLTGVTVFVLLVCLVAVVLAIAGLTSVTEQPDPSLVAWLSEQGMSDPELRLTELVHEFTPPPAGEERTAAVEDDPARASSEHRRSLTATGGPSAASASDDE